PPADHRATSAQILGGAGRNTPRWLPVLDRRQWPRVRKVALSAHAGMGMRYGVGRANSPCIDILHRAAADPPPIGPARCNFREVGDDATAPLWRPGPASRTAAQHHRNLAQVVKIPTPKKLVAVHPGRR